MYLSRKRSGLVEGADRQVSSIDFEVSSARDKAFDLRVRRSETSPPIDDFEYIK